MAVLAVAGLVINEGVDVSGLYTMGQPRTGDKRFARKYNSLFRSRTFRFINNNDLVTRLPPRVLKYRHIGEVIYLDHRGRLRSGLSRWREFLDRVRGFMVDVGELGPDAINDHFIRDYVRVIRKNRRVRPRNL
ncbi:MAG TPA: lipase family protein, partial [Nitrospiria bacterium]|nr:lipase family protein [Nitrospiria bacterium]